MRIFLDSSALAKRYIEEPGSEKLSHLCRDATEIVLSSVCVPELIAGFNRLKREGRLTAGRYTSLKKGLASDVAEALIVDLTPQVISRAIDSLERASLRSLDAIHLACALESLCDLFLTADRRQSQAAVQLGLKTELIA